MTTKLKGMSWSHPRGYDPMVETARLWRAETGVEVTWEKRSLQDFESYPVEDLARKFDLIVIDHPHVGQITSEGCLVALDRPGRDAELKALAAASVGPSQESYQWEGRQWALPIDAATQVMAYREDLMDAPPVDFQAVLNRSRSGHVLAPMLPPQSLMCLFTLTANLGVPCRNENREALIDPDAGREAVEMLADLCAHMPAAAFEMDPIHAFEAMTTTDDFHVIPLAYSYINYCLDGFRPKPLKFADIPPAGRNGPVGATLGGTGIAVSAYCENAEAAIDHAYWLASGPVQQGPFAASGGQPAHAVAWSDARLDSQTNGFYSGTRRTMDGSYIRPRHNGYMAFQGASSARLNEGLRSGERAADIVSALNAMYQASFRDT